MSHDILSLREHFGAIFDDADKDPLDHIVILSYEFDDQQVLNLVVQRPLSEQFEPRVLHLAQVAETVPVVIYDARKTREHNRLPHFMDLLPVRKPVWTCHHPKAYLIVTRKRVHLVIGSMNLTATGLFNNREVFETFSWGEEDADNCRVLEEFVRVVRKGYKSFESPALESALTAVDHRLAKWTAKASSDTASLIHQGYDEGTGLDLLVKCWRQRFGDAKPDRCIAVSPFFDKAVSEGTFARDLLAAFPDLRHLDIVTDGTVYPHMCQGHFGGIARPRLFLIPEQIHASERERISFANAGVALANIAITRKLHAKILVLSIGDQTLIYVGSANFTRKAWCGANHEMGIAGTHRGDANSLLEQILKNISADSRDHYSSLPNLPIPAEDVEDEDDYQDLVGYPEFIQKIELIESADSDEMTFVVKADKGAFEGLKTYLVTWGATELVFVDGKSQAIEQDRLLACLLGGRNLKFTCRADLGTSYYLPFRHSPALFAQRERYVYPSAEDWMFRYLEFESRAWREPDEFLPGDSPVYEDDPDVLVRAARDANPVISMQQYLSIYSRIESSFRARVKAWDNTSGADRTKSWESMVAGPLITFASVIQRSGGPLAMSDEAIFKLGELVLFVRAMLPSTLEAGPLLSRLLEKLPASSEDLVVNEYLQHCHKGH